MVNIKGKISKVFNSNVELNRKALNLKKSWDEVSTLLKIEKKNDTKQ